MRQVWFLLFLVLQSAYAAIPTVQCVEGERSVLFEEGIDDYLLDIKDYANENTVIGALKKLDRQKYLLQMRIPKRSGTEFSAGHQSCFFSETKALLFSCPNSRVTEKLKLTNTVTGEVSELTASYASVSSVLLGKESLDYRGKELLESLIRFSYQMNVSTAGPTPATSFVRVDSEFRQASCKTGEQIESPAR